MTFKFNIIGFSHIAISVCLVSNAVHIGHSSDSVFQFPVSVMEMAGMLIGLMLYFLHFRKHEMWYKQCNNSNGHLLFLHSKKLS